MKSPQALTLDYLRQKALVPSKTPEIRIKATSLDFTMEEKVSPNSEDRQLLSLANYQTYYGRVKNAKGNDDECFFIFSDGAFYRGQCKDG